MTVLPDKPSSWPQHSSPPLLSSSEGQEADAGRPTGDAVVDNYQPRTELGRKLIELRRAHIRASGQLLNWEEIDAEVRERRGGVVND